jgi:sporulation protein YlmC with PRC-barrel domain
MNMSRCAALLFAAALVSAPAFAQTTTSGTAPGATTTAPSVGSASPGSAPGTAAGMDSGATAGSGTAENNPVLTASGDVRTSEVIGSSVYNEKNDKLGSVSDILLDKSGKATQAVISVGGVLGVGAKLVAVPYDKLTFSDKVDSKTARVMMSGTDENALNGMPTFHFASK